MAEPDTAAQLVAADRRIDELIAQADQLVADLSVTVADMKRILTSAGEDVAEQRRQRAGETG